MKKKILFLCLMMVATLTFVACGGDTKPQEPKTEAPKQTETKQEESKDNKASALEAIKAKGKLVLGTSADYPPYEFKSIKDGKAEIVGFDIEIAKKIAEKLGVELEIKDMDFKLLIEALKQGQVDIVAAGLSPTPERKKEIGMSDVYYDSKQTVLIRKEDEATLNSKDSLKGKSVGAQIGSIQAELGKNIEGAKVKELPLTTALITDLKTKKIDAIIMEYPVAKQYAKNNKDLAVPEFLFENQEKGASIGVGLDNKELLEFVNKSLEEMKKDGSIDKFVVDATEISNQQNAQ